MYGDILRPPHGTTPASMDINKLEIVRYIESMKCQRGEKENSRLVFILLFYPYGDGHLKIFASPTMGCNVG